MRLSLYVHTPLAVTNRMEKHLHAPDPQLVWVKLFAIMDADKVDVRQFAGSHYTFIVEPHVKALAHNIRDALLELEGGQK
ncbi:unnamed protein product [Vitrella brassicaformis CCMP3155]|uniref:Uncharacterized protein n=1 Tax=Vitrella brassicaformis (strain CCMP3155) TaxID=1169540 RepID=A0A0G4GEZ9_VITBC|nr:unnamed protein product [Vitrella brassicaformis CCMP3155]|eukprot:CEM28080.1 unnamed protein product [Vitrella brassicaformis CCMP3155]